MCLRDLIQLRYVERNGRTSERGALDGLSPYVHHTYVRAVMLAHTGSSIDDLTAGGGS